MMTEPDDALLWARERCASTFVVADCRPFILQGEQDAYPNVRFRAEGYRAGHAARDAEVAALRARVAELKGALQWAMDEIDGRTRYPGSDVATPDEQRQNCYAIAEAALKGRTDGRD